jgi:PAS domain S-box-containing protein
MRQLLSAAQKDVNEKAAEMRNEREAAIKLAIEAQKARKDVETAKTELQDKMVEVERFNRLAMGREHRMLQLKYDINLLSRTLGRPEPFAASEATAAANDGEATLASTIDLEQIYQRFGEVVKNPAIQAMFENFCTTIGIPAAVIDLKGEVLAASRWQRACTDFHRVNEETCRRCIESDTELSLKLKEGEAFTMYGCKNGLTDCASPIIIEGTHVANAFVGQFLLQSPDIAFFKKQANEVGFDEVAYLAAIGEVPIMDEKRLPGILGFLTSFATLVGEMSLSQLHAEAAERGSRNERTAALNLAEDAEQARQQLEEYKEQLEKLIEERTADLKNLLEEQGAIFSSSPMGIILSGDGKLVRVNKKMGEVFGYDEEEMIGKATGILSISPESYAQLGATVGPDLSKGDAVQVEWQLRRKSGESFWGRLSAKSISIQGYQFSTVWMIEDITEKKQAEQAIRDAEARLRNILETSPVGIAAVADNKPVYANARYAEMLGFSREEAIAGSVKDIYANREDRERLIEQLKNDGHLPPFNFLD